jgi:hypothetical protein
VVLPDVVLALDLVVGTTDDPEFCVDCEELGLFRSKVANRIVIDLPLCSSASPYPNPLRGKSNIPYCGLDGGGRASPSSAERDDARSDSVSRSDSDSESTSCSSKRGTAGRGLL